MKIELMRTQRKTSFTLLFVALLLSTLAAANRVIAANEIETVSFISVPETAEVAQAISVDIWIEPTPPKLADSQYDFTLIVTRPDGVADRYYPLQDENGRLSWTYKPNQLGNFTFQFIYSGRTLDNSDTIYKPSKSSRATLTVTGDPLPPVEIPGGSWSQKQSMNNARGGLGVAAVKGKIYAIGGCSENGSYSLRPRSGFVGANEEYDPATDTWTTKASMPTPRSNFAIAACKEKIYCIGGALVGFELDEIYHMFEVPVWSGMNEAYDPATDTWETRTPMPVALSTAQANVVDDKIYIFDGADNWVYDPVSDFWSEKAEAPTDVGGYSSAVVDNKIYVVGYYSLVQIYDAVNDSWSQGARSPRLDPHGVIVATTGILAPKRLYFFTVAPFGWVPYGETDITGSSRRTTFIYNPESDTWSAGAVMPEFRVAFGVAVLDDKLYAIGGYVFVNLQNNAVSACAKTEEYMPIGYGAPGGDTTSPSSTSLPSPSPTPSESLIPSPIATPPNKEPKTFSINIVAVASGSSVAVVSIGLLVYFKKRNHQAENDLVKKS
jgi:N-acetylneuraminic acid mutarotase